MAAEVLRLCGLDEAAIEGAVRAFEPLPHRMQVVCERGGVRYIDNSKATSLAALEASLVMVGGPAILICGGLPKGDDPAAVLPTLRKYAQKCLLIGKSAQDWFEAWHNEVPCEVCETLENAVARCVDAPPRTTCLLAPGAASFDQFRNYEMRGERFAELVCALSVGSPQSTNQEVIQ